MSRIGQTYSSIYECFTAIRDFSAIRDFTVVWDFTTIRDFSHFTAIRDFTAVRDFTAIRDFTTVSLSPGTVRNVPHMIGLRAGITCAWIAVKKTCRIIYYVNSLIAAVFKGLYCTVYVRNKGTVSCTSLDKCEFKDKEQSPATGRQFVDADQK
jgi:hypothetical protein